MLLSLYLADRASPPEKIVAIGINYTSITFKWTAPRDTGRSNIISYRVKILQLNGTKNEQSKILILMKNTLLQHAFYDLQNGTYYQISVSGFNAAGEGGVKKAIFKTPHPPSLNAKGTMTYGGSSIKISCLDGVLFLAYAMSANCSNIMSAFCLLYLWRAH